jgi:hypothetical protein
MSQSAENDAPKRRTICPHPSYHNVCNACVREDRARVYALGHVGCHNLTCGCKRVIPPAVGQS